MKLVMFYFLSSILVSAQIFAVATTSTLETKWGTITFNKPLNWMLKERVLGMPFMFFSEKENGSRSNVSFTHTGTSIKLDAKKLQADIKNFEAGKKIWAKKVGAKVDKLDPFKSYQNKKGHTVHRLGVLYTYKNKKYHEMSYYIECGEKLIYSKALSLEKNKRHLNEVKDFVEGISCAP